MASRSKTTNLLRVGAAIIFVFVLAFVFTVPAEAKISINHTPELNNFIESVMNGEAEQLRGVYVQDVMAYPIVQQPRNNPGYVSRAKDEVTQFMMAADEGVVGLLAHNNLAGASFPGITQGNVIVLVYGDGHVEKFIVTDIYRYQALEPNSPYSKMLDLDTQVTYSSLDVFNKVYSGDRHLTLQTCIEANGNLSWGRLFIVAQPFMENQPVNEHNYSIPATHLW